MLNRFAAILLLLGPTLAVGDDSQSPPVSRLWSLRPVATPTLPEVRDPRRVRTRVDLFIFQQLDKVGLAVATDATREVLIRRAKLDLLGLPPTTTEIDAFIADRSPDAYERLVDRYLGSPRYGEAWGRMWLDLVRFAETAGFNADPIRPQAYKYRDYVIRSFNVDTPYDRFVQEQLAGDEMFPHQPDAWTATAFNIMWPDESNASNVELALQDAMNDLTANVGAVFLGLSVGCAQCHDHKFDPISQNDFYSLQSFFAGIVPRSTVPIGTQQQLAHFTQATQQWLEATAAVRTELHTIERDARAKAAHIKRLKFPKVVLDAVDAHPDLRTARQRQLAFWSERQIVTTEKQVSAQLNDAQKKRRAELKQKLAALEKSRPLPPGTFGTMGVSESVLGVPTTFLLSGGSYDDPLDEVQPSFPSALVGDSSPVAQVESPRAGTSGRRTALARWLTSKDHPLTARVIVNRVWQKHFGRGLVGSANDFGTQGQPPTHPELLDYLANEFMRSGWSIKALHRLIMNSSTYRQSVLIHDGRLPVSKAALVDADNRLYHHFARRRLSAESIRDSLLALSGRLHQKMYGPGVLPPLPPNFNSREKWTVSKDAREHGRRSVYIFAKRNLPFPMLKAFDFPDMHESCARRMQTTVAPQSLLLLNSETVLGYASDLALRLTHDGDGDGDGKSDLDAVVRRIFRETIGRLPDAEESAMSKAFVSSQAQLFDKSKATQLAAKAKRVWPQDSAIGVGIISLCHGLLNSNEFVYVE